jgi:endonuclease/exonuclease/phosphatase family metal-dependent hydrolase
MTKKNFILFFCFSVFSAFSQDIKVMTYNLRVDFGGDGENNWEFRRDFLAGQLVFYAPDFIGTQEGKVHQLRYIDSTLVDYNYIGISRDDSKTEGEFSAIFYNSKKYKAVKEVTFWLSETPGKKSKGWDAALERICTMGCLRIYLQESGFMYSIHIWTTWANWRVGTVQSSSSKK